MTRFPWVVGVSGASGTPYARAVVRALLAAGEAVDLVVSRAARLTLLDETGISWRDAHWRDDLAATDGGCTVTESTWDRRPGWFRKPGGMATGVMDRDSANAEHIRLTLERLKARAESAA